MLATIAGRDRHSMLKALTIALRTLDAVPARRRPLTDRESIANLLQQLNPTKTEAELYSRAAEWVLKEAVAELAADIASTPAITAPAGRSQVGA